MPIPWVLPIHIEANPDIIHDELIALKYTNITKQPIKDTSDTILPQSIQDEPDNLLPSPPTLPPETILLLIADEKDATTTLLTHSFQTSQSYLFTPTTSHLELSTPQTNIALRRRYVAVQKARDAGSVGILIGTLGKGGYLKLISMLRKRVLEAGKKPYLLALGKINEAKVANFAECDVFCMVACPESTVVDSRVLPSPPCVFFGCFGG
jgi:diphthamide biosynthesis enzyme Dph1/Dph2-like protein